MVANKKSLSTSTVTRRWQRAQKVSQKSRHTEWLLSLGVGTRGPGCRRGGYDTGTVTLRHSHVVREASKWEKSLLFSIQIRIICHFCSLKKINKISAFA